MLLVPALAFVALLATTPVAASPAANPEERFAFIDFQLAANNGLHAHLETSSEGVLLEISRKDRVVTYKVQGESTERGLKAQFGKLGLIDVAFRSTRTRVEKPPKGCEGKPSTDSEGLFVGTIEFTGELEYVRIEATQAKGTMWVSRESEWKCPRHEEPPRTHETRRLSALGFRDKSDADREPATLVAVNRRCSCFFAAYAFPSREGAGRTAFVGVKFESREGMEINRGTFVSADFSAFVFDHAAGTAQVHPPHPLSGSGIFKRRPHGRDLWRSTIQVPLLGADPLDVGDPGFRAELVRELPGGE